MTAKSYFQSIYKILGYDTALASIKVRYNLTWQQAIVLASDYGGGGTY